MAPPWRESIFCGAALSAVSDAREPDFAEGTSGIPDVAYNADPNTGILVYVGFFSQGSVSNGYWIIGGTSEGSPQWAGIIADANQLAGHSLGSLNPTLYALGSLGAPAEFFHDITLGNNSFAGVPGYNATPGWDLSTGWALSSRSWPSTDSAVKMGALFNGIGGAAEWGW